MSIATRKTLAKAVAALIADPRIGVAALIDNTSGPAKKGQFASVGYPRSLQIGRNERKYVNEGLDVKETVNSYRELAFSVQIFSGDAVDVAELLRTSITATWAKQFMLSLGLAFTRTSEVRDITQTEDAKREQRAQVDLFYSTIQSVDNIVLTIESVDITAIYEGQFHYYTDVIQVRKP